VANRLGPASENGLDASPNISKPNGSLPNNPPIMPNYNIHVHSLLALTVSNQFMQNYAVLYQLKQKVN